MGDQVLLHRLADTLGDGLDEGRKLFGRSWMAIPGITAAVYELHRSQDPLAAQGVTAPIRKLSALAKPHELSSTAHV
jgi:hypothetical protein